MPGAGSKAATHRSTSVVPPRVSSCFGIPAPSRWPTPPPSTTATIRMSRTLPAHDRVYFFRQPRGKHTVSMAGAWRGCFRRAMLGMR